jgi:hypothetical protein
VLQWYLTYRFLGLEMLRTIFLEQFVFRFQLIVKVVTKQPAVGAADLVRAVHNAFDRWTHRRSVAHFSFLRPVSHHHQKLDTSVFSAAYAAVRKCESSTDHVRY